MSCRRAWGEGPPHRQLLVPLGMGLPPRKPPAQERVFVYPWVLAGVRGTPRLPSPLQPPFSLCLGLARCGWECRGLVPVPAPQEMPPCPRFPLLSNGG